MISKLGKIGFTCIVASIFFSCNDPFKGVEQHEKYQTPEGLAGKLYTQVKAEEDLSVLATALEVTGYDEIFDKSGSYTILAPTDSAFAVFFQENPDYNSIEDIPVAELSRIVRFLTLQNSWNERQFRELSAEDGWGTPGSDDLKNSFVYKKETILEEAARKVWKDDEGRITDSAGSSGDYIEVPADYRKFMPVFTKEYFDYNELNSEDYELYFDRDIMVNNDIYAAEAKLELPGIFASNGFVYKLDKVVLPPDNTEEYLENNAQYYLFLDLIREFSQAGELFPYNIGSFEIGLEKIYSTSEKRPMYNHAGIVVPTNRAFNEFVENYLLSQGGMNGISEDFKREIANSFYPTGITPLFTTQIEDGFYNVNSEKVNLNPDKIIEKKFLSNATFIGYDDFIIPNIFTSVGAPLVLSNKYRLFLDAALQSRAVNALKAQNQIYAFYIVPDVNLEADSSLYISDNNGRLTTFDYSSSLEVQHSGSKLKTRILNQVALGTPSGMATKEFLPNLAGNYIVAEKQPDGSVKMYGKEPSTFGYNQPDTNLRIDLFPREITEFEISNGKAFEVDGWFNYSYKAADEIVNRIKFNYPLFFDALRKTGYLSQNEKEILFYNEDLLHTVFVPTDEAFSKANFDAMSFEDKQAFVKTHFIVGNIIFTDGREPNGNYNTVAGATVNLNPDYDVIEILKPNGETYYSIDVSSDSTNVMLTTVKPDYDDDLEGTSYATTAVLHQIDTVLFHNILSE